MKKIIIFIFINIIFSNIIYSQDAAVNFQDIYNKMKEKYSSIYPKKFEAYINGKIVEKQIATIPAKSYTSSKENIKLKFTFEQGAKPTLILENVDSFYRNMFSVFEGALETTGFYAIVGNSSTYSSFSQKFDLESVEENKNEYEITLRAKGEDKNYSVNYTVNKETLLVERAEYYNKKSKIYDVNIFYTEIGNYTLPERIKYKSSDGRVNSEIEFTDIKTF
ncbi:hypothetical protein [uncultured Brachyspira sp.]|uniref:hypothetical protein n=1 Tax=uncultured Brachyspira sp. TaxID=221953 RepID=UPI00261CE7A5|nr:hypothetical protein [uncultured Brachyspira sp.]